MKIELILISVVRVGLADLQCTAGTRRSDSEWQSGEVSESGHGVLAV